MNNSIENICRNLYNNLLSVEEGFKLLSELMYSDYQLVSDKEPPNDIELLVMSPNGEIHISSWRPAYNIFACQGKEESSNNWKWKVL